MSLHTAITRLGGWWHVATYHDGHLARETWHGGTKAEARKTAKEQEADMRERGYR